MSRVDDARLIGHRLQGELGGELRDARLSRGLRQTDVARATGSTRFHVSRVERGSLVSLGVADLSRHAAVVGLRLHARFYPTGAGLRDEAQLALLRRLHVVVGDAWNWQLEAPVDIPGDLRAFDAILRNANATVAVEAITRLRDAQAQLRAGSLKKRDGKLGRLVILVAATHANRRALASANDLLTSAFPLGSKATLAALRAGEDPGADGIVLL